MATNHILLHIQFGPHHTPFLLVVPLPEPNLTSCHPQAGVLHLVLTMTEIKVGLVILNRIILTMRTRMVW